MSAIHPTAIVSVEAELDASVTVGPYAVIGAGVRIGAGTSVGAHTVTVQAPGGNRVVGMVVASADLTRDYLTQRTRNDPKVSLDEGIARSVAWFREHRASHPEENVPVTADHEGTLRDSELVWKPTAAS